VTKIDMRTVPVHSVSCSVSIYAPDQAHACIDAFTEWQMKSPSDPKATVAMIINLQGVTIGLLYSEPSASPAVFEPFDKLTPVAVAVPPMNGTVLSLVQISAAMSSTAPMR
jgi:hypothetical protein